MSLSELRRYISTATGKDAQYYVSLIELHKKFSIPFACIVLGFLAVPLGVQSRSAKRSFGLGLGLVFFLLWCLSLFSRLSFFFQHRKYMGRRDYTGEAFRNSSLELSFQSSHTSKRRRNGPVQFWINGYFVTR